MNGDSTKHSWRPRQGLRRLDELRICEADTSGSLDVLGDMLGFASLRLPSRTGHLPRPKPSPPTARA
ncbi:hypothetical protein CCR95_02445 [Thiocystis minor]|nr:hypothetical protein [Thiocystis minor]